MNLVSNNSLENAEIRHFLDSAQLYIFCKNLNGNIIDFGTGAGFPGAVLSILGASKLYLGTARDSPVLTAYQDKRMNHPKNLCSS